MFPFLDETLYGPYTFGAMESKCADIKWWWMQGHGPWQTDRNDLFYLWMGKTLPTMTKKLTQVRDYKLNMVSVVVELKPNPRPQSFEGQNFCLKKLT